MGHADGRAGSEGDRYLAKLSEAERAVAAGDTKKTGDQLRDLYQQLCEKAREGKTDPGFAQAAQELLREIEATYGVRAIPDEERGGDENGRGGDDDGPGDDDDGPGGKDD